MAGDYLLDTNAVIAFFAGRPGMTRMVEEASTIDLPSIVVGELCFGAEASGRRRRI